MCFEAFTEALKAFRTLFDIPSPAVSGLGEDVNFKTNLTHVKGLTKQVEESTEKGEGLTKRVEGSTERVEGLTKQVEESTERGEGLTKRVEVSTE